MMFSTRDFYTMRRRSFTTSPLFLLMTLCFSRSSATIIMTDSGQRFHSQTDSHLGKPLWTGYDYYARLQILNDEASPSSPSTMSGFDNINGQQEPETRTLGAATATVVTAVSNLCTASAVQNLTVPVDGLPVALLVQGGGCSVAQKIDTALRFVQPAPVLRFLIINDLDGSAKEEDEFSVTTSVRKAGSGQAPLSTIVSFDYADPENNVIPIHVLHIDHHVYQDMLDTYLLPASAAATVAAGGPRVTIDSTSSSRLIDNATTLWVSVFGICSACLCCIMMLFSHYHQQNHEEMMRHHQQQLQQQAARRQRRRLTREQVKALLPHYRYDGEQLQLVVHPDAATVKRDSNENQIQDALLSTSSPPTTLAVSLELDCCSVCLDDYEAGDKIRVLPCQHCFHSRCVGRWLAERSATCPLCKTELMAEEEEEEEDDHEEEAGGGLVASDESFWNRLFYGVDRVEEPARDDGAAAVGREQEMTALQGDREAGVARVARQSWLRRMFRFNNLHDQERTETTDMLTEPLLLTIEEDDAEAGRVVSSPTLEHRPDPPESPQLLEQALLAPSVETEPIVGELESGESAIDNISQSPEIPESADESLPQQVSV